MRAVGRWHIAVCQVHDAEPLAECVRYSGQRSAVGGLPVQRIEYGVSAQICADKRELTARRGGDLLQRIPHTLQPRFVLQFYVEPFHVHQSGDFALEPVQADVVIRNATIHDGNGKPGYVGDVAIAGDKIVGVGKIEVAGSPRITQMALTVKGAVPGIDQAAFQKAAEAAKEGCPVSNALKGNVRFTLQAQLG